MEVTHLAHKIRLCPNLAQLTYFKQACGVARFTYNWALVEWKRQYAIGECPSGPLLKRQFNALRGEQFPWTYDVHRDCTSQSFKHIQRAFINFFEGVAGYPSFKRRGTADSFYIANDRLSLRGRYIRLPKIGWIKMREALRFTGKIVGATVKRLADAWFVIVQVDVGELRRERRGDGSVGVDLGLRTSATLSSGEFIKGPKPLQAMLGKLRRLSRWLSRKQRGSNNRRKSAMRLARLHRRIAWIRDDFLHKLTTRLCRENQAVGIEDLNVRGLIRNRRLSRAIVDEGWGEFRRQLMYKSRLYGTQIHVADRWFPSSKICSGCGAIKSSLALAERVFKCADCGVEIDRDTNAAVNLLPWDTREVTPVDTGALAGRPLPDGETAVDEAGISKCSQSNA